MCYREGIPLRARRAVIAQVLVCRGCCCGAVDKAKPEVPVNRLKEEWKTHKLKNAIQNSNSILMYTAGDKFRGLSGQESSNSHREQN
jgi:hypothetical protein